MYIIVYTIQTTTTNLLDEVEVITEQFYKTLYTEYYTSAIERIKGTIKENQLITEIFVTLVTQSETRACRNIIEGNPPVNEDLYFRSYTRYFEEYFAAAYPSTSDHQVVDHRRNQESQAVQYQRTNPLTHQDLELVYPQRTPPRPINENDPGFVQRNHSRRGRGRLPY